MNFDDKVLLKTKNIYRLFYIYSKNKYEILRFILLL
jgi:hypothetical protein